MSEVIKLSKEELDALQEFKVKNDQIVLQLGQVDVQKAILEGQRGVILESLAKLQEESKKQLKNFKKNTEMETSI